MDFDYEKDLTPNLHELHKEWLRQPSLRMEYAEELAHRQRILMQTKSKLDTRIRQHPKNFGLDKLSETGIEKMIDYQQEIIDLNFDISMLKSALKSIDQKRDALENEVKLLTMNYFAGPKEPHNLPPGKRMADAARDKASDKQREKLSRSRKRR